jgi:hypothetical protein
MGLFNRNKSVGAEVETYPLKQGTQIPLTNVSQAFIDRARREYPREPKIGHVVPVAVGLRQGRITVWFDGHAVAEMEPGPAEYYLPEFQTLAKRGKLGVTDAFVKWEGSKSPHALSLNWGRGAVGGGIL